MTRLIDTLYHYRGTAYLFHEFVVMPDHIQVLLTPKTSLEKAVQFIKGGFSHRAQKELGSGFEIWQKALSDDRVRDTSDDRIHHIYILQNPVRKHLCEGADDYPYSSARPGLHVDLVPQRLKRESSEDAGMARLEGVRFQDKILKRRDCGRTLSKQNRECGRHKRAIGKQEPNRIHA